MIAGSILPCNLAPIALLFIKSTIIFSLNLSASCAIGKSFISLIQELNVSARLLVMESHLISGLNPHLKKQDELNVCYKSKLMNILFT
jgi:hypothetical protein